MKYALVVRQKLRKKNTVFLFTRLKNIGFLLTRFRFKEIARKILFRINSDTYSIGLRRDLLMPFTPKKAEIPLTIRPLEDEDIPKIFDFENPNTSKQYKRDLLYRMEHLFADISTCYVAVTADDMAVYIQWLIPPAENEKIQAHFNGTFPVLAPDEILLESALTLEQFRNQGIRSYAMAKIGAFGRELGARWAVTFIADHNIPSLKGAKNAGFVPYMVRHERWFLFFRSLTFSKLPPYTLYSREASYHDIVYSQN
jgi:hypothetical protein